MPDEKLSELGKNQKRELKEFAMAAGVDIFKEVKENLTIKEHYFDKLESYDMADIEMIVEAFTSLQIDPSICQSIKESLIKKFQKRTKVTTSFKQFKTSTETNSSVLSKKEYYQYLLEVQQYLDLDSKKVIRYDYISVIEKIHLISLLQKLNYKESEIKELLKIIDKENQIYQSNKLNPIEQYNALYSKLKFYSNKGYCLKELQELEDYFSEIFITNDKDYEFWKRTIQETLDSFLGMIPNDYEYELQEAAIYIKK